MLPADPFDLMVWEVGVQHQVGGEFQGGGPVLGKGLCRKQCVLPPSVCGYSRADEFKGLGDLLAGLGGCPFRQHLGSEAGQAGQVLRVPGGAGIHQHPEGHYGHAALFDH